MFHFAQTGKAANVCTIKKRQSSHQKRQSTHQKRQSSNQKRQTSCFTRLPEPLQRIMARILVHLRSHIDSCLNRITVVSNDMKSTHSIGRPKPLSHELRSERANERGGARERSEQCGASE